MEQLPDQFVEPVRKVSDLFETNDARGNGAFVNGGRGCPVIVMVVALPAVNRDRRRLSREPLHIARITSRPRERTAPAFAASYAAVMADDLSRTNMAFLRIEK